VSDLASRIRSGWRPTRAEKMAGCRTIEELDAFIDMGKRFEPLSDDEVRLAQEMRAKMMGER
jgi:hypothetical protein